MALTPKKIFLTMAGIFALTACNPLEPDRLDASSSYENFLDSYNDFVKELETENPAARMQFDKTVKRYVAFSNVDIHRIDFSKGLVEIDVSSVLPRGEEMIRRSLYTTLKSDVPTVSLDELKQLADIKKVGVVAAYESRVDQMISETNKEMNEYSSQIGAIRSVLNNIVFHNAEVLFKRISGTNLPYVSIQMTNGTPYQISEMLVDIVLKNKTSGDVIISSEVSIPLMSDVVLSGENRNLDVLLADQRWNDLPQEYIYPVDLNVRSVNTEDGFVVTDSDLLDITTALQDRINYLISFKRTIPDVIESGF